MSAAGRTDIDLYLASASPRRRELLAQIGLKFELISPLDVDESVHQSESPEAYVSRLAEEKARAGYAKKPSSDTGTVPVLGADTCIAFENEILVKPVDKDDCINMLSRLSGRSHLVLTAICLYNGSVTGSALSKSSVTFKKLDMDEMERYWETGEPADKAGSYAIQGRAAKFITELTGSYSGVVGLPLFELSELLDQFGKQEEISL